MRNRLVHAYFDIDPEQVWKALTEDLPPLIEQLERVLTVETLPDSDECSSSQSLRQPALTPGHFARINVTHAPHRPWTLIGHI